MSEPYDLDRAMNTEQLRTIIEKLQAELQRVRAHEGIPVPSEWEKLQALCDANRRDAEKYQDQALALLKDSATPLLEWIKADPERRSVASIRWLVMAEMWIVEVSTPTLPFCRTFCRGRSAEFSHAVALAIKEAGE